MPKEMFLFYNLFSKEIMEGYEVGKGTKLQMKVETQEGEVTLPRDRWVRLHNYPGVNEALQILNKNLSFLEQNALAMRQEALRLKTLVLDRLEHLEKPADFPELKETETEQSDDDDQAPELPDSAEMPAKN